MIGKDSPISVPSIREMEISIWSCVDSGVDCISNSIIAAGEYVGGDSNFLGTVLITTGEAIDKGANSFDDTLGSIYQWADDTREAIGKGIANGTKKMLDFLTFWD